jgi:PAS domain S-box-containing protein
MDGRMRFRDIPIRWKLVAVTMAVTAPALLLAAIAFAAYDLISYRRLVVGMARSQAQIVGLNSRAALTFDDPKAARETLRALAIRPAILEACIYNKDGREFAEYTGEGIASACPRRPGTDGHQITGTVLELFEPITLEGKRIGTVYLRRDMSEIYERLWLYAGIAALVFIGVALAALGLATWLQRFISAPILNVARTARQVAQTRDYSVRAPKSGEDEVGVLSGDFNEMLNQIQARDTALLASEERTRSIVTSAMDCIITMDQDGRIVEFNPAAEKTFGYAAKDVVGQPLADKIVPVSQREAHRTGLARYLATGEGPFLGRRLEVTVMRADGTEFPAELGIIRIGSSTPPLFTGFVRDITDRRRAEEQLRQAQKVESIGRLAGGVAHDFNNILTSIVGFAELAQTELSPDSSAYKDLSRVLESAQRGAMLTRQLLAFARRQIIAPVAADLGEVVRRMQPMLQRLIGEDVALVVKPAHQIWTVMVDVGSIEQVIMNLAVNARDAMPRGGMLTIETQNVELDEEYAHAHPDVAPGPHVMLAVSDTAHLFEPFYTTKPVGKGTGLGLSMCHGIVKQAGGHITVYSTPGSGTTFKVYLPRAKGAEAPKPAPAPSSEHFRGTETILLVEDEAPIRELMTKFLSTLGYTVAAAADGRDALEVAGRISGPVHLLVTDVVMPRMGGLELAAQLSQLRPALRVLYSSGYTEHAIVNQGMLKEGVDFIQKPYSPMMLAQKIRTMLDRK